MISKTLHFLADFILAPINKIELPHSLLTVSYQLDASHELIVLRNTVLAVLFLSLIFIAIAASFSIGRYRRLARKISNQIKRDLAAIISGEDQCRSNQDNEIDLPDIQQC